MTGARSQQNRSEASAPTANRQRGPRADAVRNRSIIVDAAVGAFRLRPDASMNDVAVAAGVGRATVYAHFASRAELIEASLTNVLSRGDKVLGALDLDGEVTGALASLVTVSWELLDESRALLEAAQNELAPERIRTLHAPLEGRVIELIERGRAQGVFRVDLPTSWLVALMHALLQAAASEIAAGRLVPAEAPEILNRTLLATFGV